MALTPTQLQELQDISVVLAEEFPSNVDSIWDTAIRFQLAGIGPLGVGGLPVFEAAVADLKLTQEQLQTVQGRNAGESSGYTEATLEVVPSGGAALPMGLLGEVIYIDVAPSTYLATSVLSLTPAGPNSVILSEVAAQVARTVAPAAGGIEVNNLLTGAGFERVLTTADITAMGGQVDSVVGGTNISVNAGDPVNPIVNLDAAITGVSVNAVTLSAAGAATNFLNEAGAYSVPPGGVPVGTVEGQTLYWDNGGLAYVPTSEFARTAAFTYTLNSPAGSASIEITAPGIAQVADLLLLGQTNGMMVRHQSIVGLTAFFQTDAAGAVGNVLMSLENNGRVFLNHNGVTAAETASLAAGGFLVNNTVTGAGLERALTTSDLGGGAPTQLVDGAANIAVIAEGLGLTGIRRVGNTDAEDCGIQFEYQNGTVRASIGNEFFTDVIYRNHIAGRHHIFRVGIGGGNRIRLHLDGDQTIGGCSLYAGTSATPRLQTLNHGVEVGNGTLFLVEQAAQEANIAGQGQLWVNSADDSLNYITEAGVSFDLTASGVGISGTPVNNQLAVWTGATDIEGDVDLTFDGDNFQLGSLARVTDQTFRFYTAANLDSVIEFRESSAITGMNIRYDGAGTVTGETAEIGIEDGQAVPVRFWSIGRVSGDVFQSGNIFIGEKAAASADVATYGQIWVLDEGFSQSLMYTNDNGNDFEIAALNLTFMNASALLVTGTGFVEAATFQPDINRNYMINAALEVTSPAADDMKVEMVIDTNAVFKGILTYSNQAAGISGTFALESGIGDVITNIVVVPTDGSATPDGTYITIVGGLNMGATSGTHSIRCGKNADTGADGRVEGSRFLQASVLQVS